EAVLLADLVLRMLDVVRLARRLRGHRRGRESPAPRNHAAQPERHSACRTEAAQGSQTRHDPRKGHPGGSRALHFVQDDALNGPNWASFKPARTLEAAPPRSALARKLASLL